MKSIALKPNEVMTTPQACRELGITRQTMYAWLQRGQIKPWMKVGGGSSWLFVRREVDKLKENGSRRDNGQQLSKKGRT